MKRAIIVGATSGIGQEIAKVLLAQGWKIGKRTSDSISRTESGTNSNASVGRNPKGCCIEIEWAD